MITRGRKHTKIQPINTTQETNTVIGHSEGSERWGQDAFIRVLLFYLFIFSSLAQPTLVEFIGLGLNFKNKEAVLANSLKTWPECLFIILIYTLYFLQGLALMTDFWGALVPVSASSTHTWMMQQADQNIDRLYLVWSQSEALVLPGLSGQSFLCVCEMWSATVCVHALHVEVTKLKRRDL